MSPIHSNTSDTLKKPSNKDKEEQERETKKDTSVDISTKGQEGPQVLGRHIQVNKEENKIYPSATIFVSSTDIPIQLSGDTASPPPKVVPSSKTSTPHIRSAIKNLSPSIEVNFDEVIEMPKLDLENLTLEKKKNSARNFGQEE